MTKIDKEKIVDYAFERDQKSNVLAIHPSRPLIAYLINIQRTPKITKGWSGGNETQLASQTNGRQSSNSSIISSSIHNGATTTTNHSIRIIDYDTRQRCLAKGVYHARPADCVFTINSLICSQNDVIKLAVVDWAANIYLYDLAYLISGLNASRIAVIRGPGNDVSPYESIVLVWCPFVPCEDFEDGDGGLRLALATNSKIEIFAIDRLVGRTGEMQRSDLKGAYKCIQDVHETNVVTLSISPDCSTISAASHDHRVTFYSSDIEDSGQRCLHNWTASIMDGSPISKLFFLDDYPKLLEDSTMKFWGAAFIGTRSGEIILVNLRNWTVYQRINIQTHSSSATKNFDYRIDSTSRNIVAMNGNQCYIVQIEQNHTDPKAKVSSPLPLGSNSVYSFVIKHASDDELHLFTISAYSLERYTIDLKTLEHLPLQPVPPALRNNNEQQQHMLIAASKQQAPCKTDPMLAAASIASLPTNVPTGNTLSQLMEQQTAALGGGSAPAMESSINGQLDIAKMDRIVENLFSQINVAFHAGLKEFFNDIKCEMNDLNLKVTGLSRDNRSAALVDLVMVSRPQAYFGLAVLFVINAINFADRLSITTMLANIKEYYGVEDMAASALAPAFLFGYMFTAPVFGHLGDRYSRKWIVIGGIAFWCMACASALLFGKDHFYLFLLSRGFVGIGEASYSTIAPTLIGDLFPPERRKLALSIFYFAIPIGTGLGFIMGKIALSYGDWTLIFKMTPSIGAAALCLLVFFKEPKRGEMDGGSSEVDDKDASPLMDRIKYLYDIKSYVWGTIGFTCCVFTMGALSWHAIDFMAAANGDNYRGDASLIFGLIVCVAGLSGVTIGSCVAQYFRPIDGRADPLVCAFGVLLAIPLSFVGLILARSALVISWIFLFFSVTALSTNWAVISDMVLSVTAPNKRAFATAGQLLISHMFGDALSPFIVGIFKDLLKDQMSDQFHAFLYAIIPTLVVLGLGVPAFLYSAKFYVKDVENCKQRTEAVRSDDANLTDFAN